ncbi:hypothetical protein [Streptomyces globisporus]
MSTHDTQVADRRLFAVAGLGTLAYVGIWPVPTDDDGPTKDTYVDAAHPGMTPREFAYVLRQLGDRFDEKADAEGEPPFDADALAEANARNAEAGR